LPKKDFALALHAIRAGKTKLVYAPNLKIPLPPKNDNPAKDMICHECNEIGQWRRNCPQYLAELMKKKKQAQGASTLGSLNLYVGNGHRAAVLEVFIYVSLVD
ncbi:zinc finger, CCHC-type containing protein, partial [Tanacetum coccineum]